MGGGGDHHHREEEWRRNADTHKLKAEDVKATGAQPSQRPPRHNPGEVLHQRRKLPYSPYTIGAVGFLLVGAVWYGVLYANKKPEASYRDVAKAATGVADPEETHPRRN